VRAQVPLLEKLTDADGQPRPSERKVARAVLADPTRAVQLSMASLASIAGVSEPTVMRFCTSLGFGGFQSFKFALAEVLAVGIPVTYSAITVHDSASAISVKILDHTLSSLDRTRRSLDSDAVTAAVDVLRDC